MSSSRLLRSSPGPETGCSYAVVVDVRPQADVAILTRSGDRVQLGTSSSSNPPPICCDPHPVRRPGAASWQISQPWSGTELRSSPGPETGCSPRGSQARAGPTIGCDPHPVRRPGAAGWTSTSGSRPQPLRSSPGPETGCSTNVSAVIAALNKLRSSPGPETGCSVPPGPRSARPRSCCDPHPVRRPGAAPRVRDLVEAFNSLRSSPGPETGCSYLLVHHGVERHRVAILTRSGDRVQLCSA